MSSYKMWTFTCDDCGEIHDSGQGFKKTDELDYARGDGWVQLPGDIHYCNYCRKEKGLPRQKMKPRAPQKTIAIQDVE